MRNHIQRMKKMEAEALALCDQRKDEVELSLQAGDIVHLLAMARITYLDLPPRQIRHRRCSTQTQGRKA